MSTFTTFILFSCFGIDHTETPSSICTNATIPYKTKDGSCSSFGIICSYKENAECVNFLRVCAQCPLSNNSFVDFFMKRNEELLENVKRLVNINIAVTITIALISLAVLTMKAYTMKKKSKYKRNRRHMNVEKNEYNLIPNNANYDLSKLASFCNFLTESSIQSKLEGIFNLPSKQDDKNCEITFKIDGESESLKLVVGRKETVVEVKKRIWSLLSNTANDHYKILKLEYEEKILEDNQHLLKSINHIDHIVYCKRDPSVGTQEIVLEQRENEDIPSLIQVKLSQTIRGLKNLVSSFVKEKDFIIFDTYKVLDESQTIEGCNLKDGDCIRVIMKKCLKLSIKCVFEESDCTTVEVKNTDPVSSIIDKIAEKTNANPKDFLLLLESQHLDPDKYLFQYNIDDKSAVKYYCLMRPDDIEKDSKPIDKGYISWLYKAKFRSTNKRIFLQRYIQNNIKLHKDKFGILNQLETFEMTKYNEHFVKLLGIYKKEDILYVAMNDEGEETLTQFLNKNSSVKEDIIAKWTRQIMEALRYLHEKKIIYRCLMPYEILIDEKKNLKLNSFCLSKYTVRNYSIKIFEGKDSSQTPYMAPDRSLSKAADVWSLGVLLIRISTGKDPDVIDNGDISYILPIETSEELQRFICSCVKRNPVERRNIDELFESDFIKKYEFS